MATNFVEGGHPHRPPLFDGSHYNYWCYSMECFVQAKSFRMWKIITNGDRKVYVKRYRRFVVDPNETDEEMKKKEGQLEPMDIEVTDLDTVDIDELADSEIAKIELNQSAKILLLQALSKEERNRVLRCKSAKEIWDCLKTTHEGTSQVKNARISLLTKEYEMFNMRKGEKICEMQGRFDSIVNKLRALGREISRRELNSKILFSLTKEYKIKASAIEESKDLDTLPFEELMGSLGAEELKLEQEKLRDEGEERSQRKNLALQSKVVNSSNDEEAFSRLFAKMETLSNSSDEEEDALGMFARKFRKHFNKRNYGKGEASNKFGNKKEEYKKGDQPRCFHCNELGHFKSECPQLKKGKYPQRKAMKAHKYEGHTSDEDSDEEEEVANAVCFMALDTIEDSEDDKEVVNAKCVMARNASKVSSKLNSIHEINAIEDDTCSMDEEDIHDAYDELYKEHETMLVKNKNLAKENKALNSRLAMLEKEVALLKVASKGKEIDVGKHDIEQSIAKLKVENEALKNSLSKFKLSELTQKKIFDSQPIKVGRGGIGFVGHVTKSFSNTKQGECSNAKTIPPPKFVKSSKTYEEKEATHPPHKITTHTCTYCQLGNHQNSMCYIRKLCEMGTLIPEWKNPKWIVKKSTSSNPLGPKKSWVPRKQH